MQRRSPHHNRTASMIKRALAICERRGARADLARHLGVTPSTVGNYLGKQGAPEAWETAYALQEWVEINERNARTKKSSR